MTFNEDAFSIQKTMRSAALRLSRRSLVAHRPIIYRTLNSTAPALASTQSDNAAWTRSLVIMGVVLTAGLTVEQNRADCCGIVGVVAPKGYDAR